MRLVALAKSECSAKANARSTFIPPAKAGGNSKDMILNNLNINRIKNPNNPFNLYQKKLK